MSKATASMFHEVIVKAVLDKEFRKIFLASPALAIKDNGFNFDAQDLAGIELVLEDIRRFAQCGVRAEEDAKSWAIGICQVKTVSSTPVG